MAKDPKKYPWIKSIFKKNKKNPENPEIIEGVYAGPDMWNGKKKDGPDAEIECVYAGPDMFGDADPAVPEEDQDAPEAEIEDVYAGPGMFSKEAEEEPAVPETDPDAPEADQDAPEAEIEDVYAGPGIPPMALVYAGPDYFKRKAEDATPEDANAGNNSENPEGLA